MRAIKWGLGISLSLIILIAISIYRQDNQPATPSPPPTPQQQQNERQRKAQEEFALSLTQAYRNQGFDVLAVPNDHTLELLSESFKDPVARNAAVADLIKIGGHKRFCDLGIWTVAVGYRKGMLSGEVTLKRSLGCRAEKAAREAELQALQPEREKLAAEFNVQAGGGKVDSRAEGRVWVMESEGFTLPEMRQLIVESTAAPNVRARACEVGFTEVHLKAQSKTVKPILLRCP